MATPPIYYSDDTVSLYHGDSLEVLRGLTDGSVDCCVTSPPYFGLRDYGTEGQYGLEASPAEYVETMRALFAEVRRVLADDGTLWLNLGDSYTGGGGGNYGSGKSTKSQGGQQVTNVRNRPDAPQNGGLPAKNLLGVPWRTAFALQADGWILRNDIIWAKPNAMPESVTDRLSSRHEHLFLFSKARSYWFDLDPIREPVGIYGGVTWEQRKAAGEPIRRGTSPRVGEMTQFAANEGGRNPGDVWTLPTQPFGEAHFAVMPGLLAERSILAGCKPGGAVLDPFSGSGTTGLAATKHGRKYVGIDLSRDYLDLSLRTRFAQPGLDFGGVA